MLQEVLNEDGNHRDHKLIQKWDRLAAMYIIKDLRPLDSLDGDGIQDWIETMMPCYSLPSRSYLLYDVIWPMYYETKELIKAYLNKNDSISLTTDAWGSMAHHSYISLTAHFIDAEFKLNSFLLSTEKIIESHTGENLLAHMEMLIKEWGIDNKQVGEK